MRDKQSVLFIQGGGKGAHDEWDSKLVANLRHELGQRYEVHYPRMPHEDAPSFARWKPALRDLLETHGAGVVLVAHSVGGTMLLAALAEQSPRGLIGLFFVATPFVGTGGWSAEGLELPADLGARLPPSVPVHFFHGLADETAPPAHVELYARAIPQALIHRLRGRDHQLNGDLKEVAAAIRELGPRPAEI